MVVLLVLKAPSLTGRWDRQNPARHPRSSQSRSSKNVNDHSRTHTSQGLEDKVVGCGEMLHVHGWHRLYRVGRSPNRVHISPVSISAPWSAPWSASLTSFSFSLFSPSLDREGRLERGQSAPKLAASSIPSVRAILAVPRKFFRQ